MVGGAGIVGPQHSEAPPHLRQREGGQSQVIGQGEISRASTAPPQLHGKQIGRGRGVQAGLIGLQCGIGADETRFVGDQ